MSKFTKAAIMQSFMKLLNENPFDKITVKDIVNDCGINRNTFYYNFQDIYALVDEILQSEINKIAEKHKNPYTSWSEGLKSAADFALNNKKAIYHLHNSIKRQQLEKYIGRVIYDVVAEFVETESKGEEISYKDMEFIASFYTCALIGLMNRWLENDMKEDFNEVINKTGILFDSNIKHAVKALAEQN